MRAMLLLHGPNLNLLGTRSPEHYGSTTLRDLEIRVREWGRELQLDVQAYQSNHEGALIDKLQQAAPWAVGAIVNLGALTHTSYALHDAILDFGKPVVEVHLSKLDQREPWRRVSVIRPACVAAVDGHGIDGYRIALSRLVDALSP